MNLNRPAGLLLALCAAAPAFAQAPARTQAQPKPQAQAPTPLAHPVTLSGTVSDPSGATIVHAAIHLHSDRADLDTVTDRTGHFQLELPSAAYDLTVEAEGFRLYSRPGLALSSASTALNIKLEIATEDQQVDVSSDASASTSAADNASGLVFKADGLATLSDDPNVLQQQLLALSGTDPSSPSQIYVDGFSNGTLPPKDSIREIRLNQDPFTAQSDQFGLGRIEIFTKPGGDKVHGSVDAHFGTSALNARNPYTGPQPAYVNDFIIASVDGPVGKASSFYLTVRRIDVPANGIVNATVLDANLNPSPFSQSIANPNVSQTYRVRGDHQFGKSDTLIARYIFADVAQPNLGVGSLVLPSQASRSDIRTHTVQLTDTHIVNAKLAMEADFQYIRTRQQQDALSTAPSIVVQGAFSAGGSPLQALHDDLDRFELRDYLSLAHGTHFIRTGARYRLTRDANLNTSTYNGQFIFSSLTAFQITQQGLRQHLTDQQIRSTCVSGTNGIATCGGASQFSLTVGNPRATISTADLSVFAEDEWTPRPGLTFNYGLRLESQTAVPDKFDLAPRLGFAYAIKPKRAKTPMFVVRGGFGLFFTRFESTYILQARRQNGITQQSNLFTDPVFTCAAGTPLPCLTPDLSQATTGPPATPTIYTLSPHLRSPIQMQGLLTVEHTFGKRGRGSFNYYHLRTTHLYDSLNIDAPLPSTGQRPLGKDQNIYQYSSEGVSKWFLFNGTLSLELPRHISLWTYAGFGQRMQTAFGPDQFPSNSFNPGADFARPATFASTQVSTGITAHPGWGITTNLFIGARNHSQFNITTGQDNNGDSIYNDRPSFATVLTRKSVVHTVYGDLDTDPLPGQTIIPFNYGRAPGVFYNQIGANKSFRLGPRPSPAPTALKPSASASPKPGAPTQPGSPASAKPSRLPDPAFQLEFGIEVDNIFNTVNPGIPVGVLSSPLFGRSLSLTNFYTQNNASNRTLMFHAKFAF